MMAPAACIPGELATEAAQRPDAEAPDSSDGSAIDGAEASSSADTSSIPTISGCPRPTGLVLWLDDSSIEGTAAVTRWRDLSGNAFDASPSASAPTIAAGPGGHHAVRFGGTTSFVWIAYNDSLQFGTDDFMVSMIASWTNPPGQTCPNTAAGVLWSHVETQAPYWGLAVLTDMPFASPAIGALYAQVRFGCPACVCGTGSFALTQNALNDGAFRLVGARLKHASGQAILELRVAGVAVASASVDTHDMTGVGNPVYIGGDTGGLQQVQGAIAAVVVTRGVTADGDVAALERCLTERYGL
jgi:hypothetical protein